MFACNPVRLSKRKLKATYLLTYLLTYLFDSSCYKGKVSVNKRMHNGLPLRSSAFLPIRLSATTIVLATREVTIGIGMTTVKRPNT